MEIPEEVVRGEEKGEEDEGGGKEGEDLGEGKYCLQHLRLCNICKLDQVSEGQKV